MLKFDRVTKIYSGNRVLNEISIEFQIGKLYALVGPNGSGKTTLMKAAAGLVKPESGVISFNGVPISPQTKADIAYMPTEPYYYNFMTIAQVGQYHKDFFPDFDTDYFRKLLNYMELNEKMKVKSLSSGMAAKLKISATLARRSKVIMLDEPLNGIDIIARDQIISSILASASNGSSFIISSHLFDELEPIVNDIVMLRMGQIIINGDINEVRKANNKSISDLYREIYGSGMFNPYGTAPNMPAQGYGMPQQYYQQQTNAPYGYSPYGGYQQPGGMNAPYQQNPQYYNGNFTQNMQNQGYAPQYPQQMPQAPYQPPNPTESAAPPPTPEQNIENSEGNKNE